jgi:hypothetical protein
MRKKKEIPGQPTYSKKYNKTQRNQKSKSHHSILHYHEKRLEEFKNKDVKIKIINDKINELKKEILKITKNNNVLTLPDISILKKNILEFENEKKIIEMGQDEITYLLESNNIILEYMTLEETESKLLEVNDFSSQNTTDLNNINSKKTELIDVYFTKFDNNYTGNRGERHRENLYCTNCNNLYDTNSGFMVCQICGICVNTVEQAAELSYKEMQEIDYRPQFTYDKMSHLEDWLRRFQAKENRSIPQEILDKVLLEAKKERVTDLNTLTEDKIKRYLKKLNLNDYYDNVIGIINRINGRPPFRLTNEIEFKIKMMFQQIQDPYEKFKPPNRKNFLSYSYCLHKLFQILGLHEFAKYFPLLKSTDKLRQQDDIFKKIVGYMSQQDKLTKWVFYPSI